MTGRRQARSSPGVPLPLPLRSRHEEAPKGRQSIRFNWNDYLLDHANDNNGQWRRPNSTGGQSRPVFQIAVWERARDKIVGLPRVRFRRPVRQRSSKITKDSTAKLEDSSALAVSYPVIQVAIGMVIRSTV